MYRVLQAIAILTFFTAAALAQSTNGSITGVVTDSSGAVIAGAKISAQNKDTGFVYTADSTSTGNYSVTQLPTGTYDLRVESPGFKVFQQNSLAVAPANVLRIDVPLAVGETSDTISVT